MTKYEQKKLWERLQNEKTPAKREKPATRKGNKMGAEKCPVMENQ